MNKVIPFVKRFKELCPRLEGYSTALSSRYDGWGGLYDNPWAAYDIIISI